MNRVVTGQMVQSLIGIRSEVMRSESGWIGCSSLLLRGTTFDDLPFVPELWLDWISRMLEVGQTAAEHIPDDVRRARDGKTYIQVGPGWFPCCPLAYAQPDRTVVMANVLPATRGHFLVGYRSGEPVIILADAGLKRRPTPGPSDRWRQRGL